MDKLDAMTKQVRDFCDARDWRKYLRFVDLNGIDLPAALSSKLIRNGERYPINASSDEYRKAGHRE